MMHYDHPTVSEAVLFGGAEGFAVTFEQVYKEHFAFVWRSLRRLGVREEDANDAAQEVFIVVHRKLSEFSGRSKMTTWLYGICFRVASERKRARRPLVLGEHDAVSLLGEHPDPGVSAERNEGLAVLEQVLDRMPPEQRAVFCLFEARRHDRRSDCRAGGDPARDRLFTTSPCASGFRRRRG